MRVAIPHNLDRETVRQRLHARSHEIADHIPGGMAEVHTAWRSEDVMEMSVSTFGQELHGDVVIEEGQLVFNLALPPALGFLGPVVEGAIKQQGQKLIAPPAG